MSTAALIVENDQRIVFSKGASLLSALFEVMWDDDEDEVEHFDMDISAATAKKVCASAPLNCKRSLVSDSRLGGVP